MPADLSPLWISLKVALLGTAFSFGLGIAAAYWMLGYRGKAKSVIEGLLIAPLVLPPTVVGFVLLLVFGKNGIIGQVLLPLGISVVFSWYGAVMTAAVVAFPLMYKTTLGAFEQIDQNLLGAARTLGASEWVVFRRILLPLALPGIVAATTLAFARALGEFGATLMLAGNIPGQTQTIPMAIYLAVETGAIQDGWFWVIVILVISLSGICTVNIWQARRAHPSARRQFPSMPRSPQSDLASIPNPSTPVCLEPPYTATAPCCLDVDLYHPLSDFQLQVSFRVHDRPLGLLGGSGAGKSMILRCIAGVETPLQGRIVLNGRVLFDSERGINIPSRDRRIGYLIQNYALFPHMTVAENIAFGLPQSRSHSAIHSSVEEQLSTLQLTGLAHRYPHQLSGGQQQRVALARALVSHPEALLLDEPFSALDTHLRSQLEQEMTYRLSQFSGVCLFVTHNLEEAYRVCDDLLVLEQGRAIAQGSKHQVFEHPRRLSVAQLTGCKNFSRAIASGEQQIYAEQWDCRLSVIEPIPLALSSVGIRAHHLTFTQDPSGENTFPCWLVTTSETPHRMTLFLKLHTPPEHDQDHQLQAEVFKDKWHGLKLQPLPWLVQLNPFRLMLVER